MALYLLLFSLLLSGCTSRTENRLYEMQAHHARSSLSFSAHVYSLGEGAVWEFSALVRSSGMEEGAMTLSAPTLLEGVTLRWGEETGIEYGDVVLALPDLYEEGPSPASVLPLFCRVLREGWLLRYRQDREGVTACYGLDDGCELSIRYDKAFIPRFVEYYAEGERRMWAEITEFITETEEKDGREEKTDLGGDRSLRAGT